MIKCFKVKIVIVYFVRMCLRLFTVWKVLEVRVKIEDRRRKGEVKMMVRLKNRLDK